MLLAENRGNYVEAEADYTAAVIGGIIAAVLGSPRTVYRFNPDSPKQVSVVIGVGPMTTPCGSVE